MSPEPGAGAGFARRFRRALAAAARTVTPTGWVFIALVPIGITAGHLSGWRELVTVGIAAAILVLVAALHLRRRSEVAAVLEVATSRTVVGHRATGSVAVLGRAAGRIFGAELEVPVGGEVVRVAVPAISRGLGIHIDFEIPTGRRGLVIVGPVRSVRADPVGLLRRELVAGESRTVVVRPRTVELPGASTGFIRDLEGRASRDLTDSDVSFHALREYVPGDDQRYIHWKSTARTGTHMVRQFEETRRSRLVVALGLREQDYASADEFELAVSAAGSLGIRSIRDASELSVIVGRDAERGRTATSRRRQHHVRRLSSVSRDRLLDDLAGVERAPASPAIADVASVVAERTGGISLAYLLCGSPVTPTALRAASSHFPTHVEVVAVVCDAGAVPGLRRLAGITVLTIGYLEDLRLSLLRMATV